MTEQRSHHGLPAHEVVLLLETNRHVGLTRREAARRLEQWGPNELPRGRRVGPLRRLGRQFHNPLIYVLLSAAVVTWALGEYVDFSVIVGVVVVNATVGFLQESRAEAALDALRLVAGAQANVVRDGRTSLIDARNLVPGDLVLLKAGDKVPADVRIVEATGLAADESALTGESLPVRKEEIVLPEATAVADRLNMVYSGTLVTSGSGSGIAVETGASTELGHIHRLVAAADRLATPLTRKLADFSKILTFAILGLAAVTFAVGLAQQRSAGGTFTAAVALAVGAIPEGLPAAVTITLAIGVSRMARRRAIVRRMPAVETLGSTTVICSDKTGTLTQNTMTVREVWTPERAFVISAGAPGGVAIRDGSGAGVDPEEDAALHWSLLAGALCTDALAPDEGGEPVGDATEGAMLALAMRAGIDVAVLGRELPRVGTIPFSWELQHMVTVHRDTRANRHVVLVKGSPETVVARCSEQVMSDGARGAADARAALQAAEVMAARGLRVLATAVGEIELRDSALRGWVPERLALTGLQAMMDPLRPAARPAVKACVSAGIRVKMITGDHATTATAIARDLGLIGEVDEPGAVVTGAGLERLDDDAYASAALRAAVFARVTPEQKLRLVRAMQARGEVVAMTGDGVNDAPALQQADIGVAMGRGGTEVAKEASDIVLTDDDFATIEAAVEEGRAVFDNLTKFIVWTLPTNMGEGLVILAAILSGGLLPVLPTQILWINMTTAVALGLMLAFEPKEPGIMLRPPRDPARPLFTRGLMRQVVLVAGLLVAGSWWLFAWELSQGSSLAAARTAAVNVFVAVEIVYLFSCRSLTSPAWRVGPLSNPFLVVGVMGQVLLQAAVTYLPGMNALFHTAPLAGDAWLRIAGIALVAGLVVSLDKHLRARARRSAAVVRTGSITPPRLGG